MGIILILATILIWGLNPGMEAVNSTVPFSESAQIAYNDMEYLFSTRKVKEVREVWVTAYSSAPEETDDTPFITASGEQVRDGILAANFLPFGAEVQIPDAFGDKIFIVEDRMHPRKVNNVDVWMPTKDDALKFGAVFAEVLVLAPPEQR